MDARGLPRESDSTDEPLGDYWWVSSSFVHWFCSSAAQKRWLSACGWLSASDYLQHALQELGFTQGKANPRATFSMCGSSSVWFSAEQGRSWNLDVDPGYNWRIHLDAEAIGRICLWHWESFWGPTTETSALVGAAPGSFKESVKTLGFLSQQHVKEVHII